MARATKKRFAKFAKDSASIDVFPDGHRVSTAVSLEDFARAEWRKALSLGHTVHRCQFSFECSSCGRSSGVYQASDVNAISGDLFDGERCSK